MTHRSLRFRMGAVLLAALAISSLGCMKKKPAGELVGVYAISGALEENTCGQSALPTSNPLRFNVEIRNDDGVGTWQLEKQESGFAGLLRDDGEFRFQTQQNVTLGQETRPRRDLMPGDFLSLDPDLDLEKRNCTLLIKETMHGSLHRSEQTLDGGIGDAGAGTEDLTGKNTIEVQPAAGSDCSYLLTSQGGSYLALPCGASYELEGALQVTDKDDDDEQ